MMKLGLRKLRALLPAVRRRPVPEPGQSPRQVPEQPPVRSPRRETDGIYLDAKIRQLGGRGRCQGGIVAKLGVSKDRVHRALHPDRRRRFAVCCRDIHGGRFHKTGASPR